MTTLAQAPVQPRSLDGRGTIDLATSFHAIRQATERLCAPLVAEDYVIQSMPEASPVKWHLAHSAWFFETFVLLPHQANYQAFHPQFAFLFNSYYDAVGPRWSRPQRGLLSRPTVGEVYDYRAYVDEHMRTFLASLVAGHPVGAIVLLGLNHEQQHQELILTDLKHAWAASPLHPIYRDMLPATGAAPVNTWLSFPEGLAWIGHDGDGFAFDNESPRHRVFLHGFQLASRLVSNVDYVMFLNDRGYERPEWWLADGWAARQAHGWTAPLYWQSSEGAWSIVTLAGVQPLQAEEPVCHLSFYEADAYARWAGARLPTEAEWETAAAGAIPGGSRPQGHFLEGGRFHPAAAPVSTDCGPLFQMFGDVWQWTASPYIGYPGYQPPTGALGEYNGKFMCNQFVLRGASCATPRSHARRTYRNFFPPEARWQFTGLRLARDLKTPVA
jgi:ergothioneine biosynthesis protein EgtB